MYTPQENRQKVLDWLRSDCPNHCRFDLTKDGCFCPLGYVAYINNLPKNSLVENNPWSYPECAELLGFSGSCKWLMITDINDHKNTTPRKVADKLELLFQKYPVG